jgi:hypothetical protein
MPENLRLRRQRQCEAIWRLGARAVFELIDEIDRYSTLGDDLDRRLSRYAALDPELIEALSCNKFPPAPLRIVACRP